MSQEQDIETIENEFVTLLNKYNDKKILFLKHLDNCRTICDRYESIMMKNQLNATLIDFLKTENVANIENFSIENYNITYHDKKLFSELITIKFGNSHIFLKYDFVEDGEMVNDDIKFYITSNMYFNDHLILKKNTKDKNSFINLTLIKEYRDKELPNIELWKLCELFTMLCTTKFGYRDLIEKIKINQNLYFFDIDWESDSDIGMDE
ncbi:hypothetical protein BMW23_0334 [Bodo saltans virus]|uniref:Uncharacterized protein n=1 Tax=Bodo saltans virus TaxID=2024608 RepID=A0A2H4UTX1_9VIRU|nr:hypothetical protein QJ851_gp0328 [Bodo saltans virus]ATZ80391.1 hypothetical protein BMW23_0334 [Bodo saltans virus]